MAQPLQDIYFPSGFETSGLHGTDYLFAGGKTVAGAALVAGDYDAFVTSGSLYLGEATLNIYESSLLRFASGVARTIGVDSGFIINSGSLRTLKGVLINQDPVNYPSGVSVFRAGVVPVNIYDETIVFKNWSASGLSIADPSGLFLLTSGSIQANYEPRFNRDITAINESNTYFTSWNSIRDLLNKMDSSGLIEQAIYQRYVVNNLLQVGTLFPNEIDSYYVNYFIPMYASGIHQFGFDGRPNDSVFANSERLYRNESFQYVPSGLRDLDPELYLLGNPGQGGLSSSSDQIAYKTVTNANEITILGNIAGNYLREWDVFVTIVDSGMNIKSSGVLLSSGFQYGSGATSSTNSGFIQVTTPLVFNARVDAVTSGVVRFSDENLSVGVSSRTDSGIVTLFADSSTYSGISLSSFDGDAAKDSRFEVTRRQLIASFSNLALADGDLIFVRYEINHDNPSTQLQQRYLVSVDTTAPTISGVAVFSNNAVSPVVAKAGNLVRVMIEANEPIIFNGLNSSKPANTNGTNVFFTTSGAVNTILNSGHTNVNPGFSSTNTTYSTLTYDQLSVLIAPTDSEGYFNFSGLVVRDRAGNPTQISYTSGTGGFNKLWVDPIAPSVTSSGFITNQFTSGLVADGSPATLQSGVLGGIPFYRTSGILEYDFNIFESMNDITSGAMQYTLTLVGSGAGGYTAGVGEFENRIGVHSGDLDGETQVTGTFVTSGVSNGLYLMTLRLEDYVGNVRTVQYYFHIENPIFYTDLDFVSDPSDGSGLTEVTFVMEFSNFVVNSGTFDGTKLELRIVSSSGGTLVATGNSQLQVLSTPALNGTNRTIQVRYIGSQWTLLDGDVITITVLDNGLSLIEPKLQFLLQEAFAQTITLDFD
jgi:hypothetical protein